jgi:SRSO17 transposase
VTAILADAEFGDVTAFRRALHRWRLPYAVGISRHLTVFPGTPAVHVPANPATGRPRSRLVLAPHTASITVKALAEGLPRRAWRRVTWRNGTNRRWAARFAAVRVTPAHDWRDRRVAPEIWLVCEQDLGATPRTKYFFVNLPRTASVKQLVRLAHQRWAIEQQYQELKTELGFDHFEGRSYPGWQHHVVLSAVAYAFLQRERMRRDAPPTLTFPAVHAIVQEIFTALLFAQQPDYYKRIQELQKIDLRI